jgi:tryptophanyl-tRNA synthetase
MNASSKVSLTGLKPTGQRAEAGAGSSIHLGNYFGAIRPAIELTQRYSALYFIADYHSLTSQRDPGALRSNVYDIAATWITCGLDTEKAVLFRQSDVPEVFELTWVLACLTATGQLERGHAYKDAVARGEAPNAGVFNYPLLMAADILLYDTNVVPIGADQKQHLELTRDIALRVNHHYGDGTLVVPEAVIGEGPVIPGFDGQKMSKSYGNTIPLFLTSEALRKAVLKYKSDSTALEAPKEPAGTAVFELYKQVASAEDSDKLAAKLRAGGYGWGHAKQELFEALDAHFAGMRAAYLELRENEPELDRRLAQGAERARERAQRVMARVRIATGVR